jgi:GDP-L-fucose synthase
LDKNTRIYVAGHSGLIGSALARRLERENYRGIITAPRAQLDLKRAADVRAFFERERPEVVLLAAGYVGGIVENQRLPSTFITENLVIQLNVMTAAHEVGVQRLVFFASSCMYPRDCAQPMSEGALLTGKPEETSLPYALAKLAGVHMCLAFNNQYGGIRFLPVIPNSAYGPNDDFSPQSSHVISALIRRMHEAKLAKAPFVELWGTGAPRREFVHADDIADACHFLLQRNVSGIAFPINIGVGSDYSIRELACLIARVVEYRGNLKWDKSKPDGAPRKLLDSSRLRALGWQPALSLEEGLKSTYEWYLRKAGEPVGEDLHI